MLDLYFISITFKTLTLIGVNLSVFLVMIMLIYILSRKIKSVVVYSLICILITSLSAGGNLLLNVYVINFYSKLTSTDTISVIADEGIKVNEESKYKDEWVMYVSFRDMEIGRLGSKEKFRDMLDKEGITERDYATKTLEFILQDMHRKDYKEVAEKAVKENFKSNE